ncbi:MAG: hypothetical protein KF684_13265 [Phycisphaeraceae bacterium]|nr:hypothetical protein [Phycisphaeraceae bacterium]
MPLMFRRDDGAPLSGSDIDRGIHLVHLAFSFLRGGLVAPFLIEKFDREWTFCGTRYYAPMYDASQPGPGWSRGISAENFRKYIQSFLAAASDQAVLDRLKSIIPWYCQASPISSFKPTSIVLGQIALEAVAWGAARSGPLPLSPEGYKKLPAADKIRVALLRHGISACPASMFSGTVQSSVRQLAEKNRDVVGLLVDLRNALVHAEPSKHVDPSAISGIDLLHIHDASQQLVEMLLLREIGYNEEIFRRSVGSQYEDV